MSVSLAGAAAGEPAAAWFGTWALDLQASTYPLPPEFKRVTCTIEPWEDAIRVTYDLVGLRGGVTHLEWTGQFDGNDYTVQGVDYVLTNSYTRIDDRTYEVTQKMDGRVVATSRITMSPDGKRLTTVTPSRDRSRGATTAVYERR
jgi:hypothetical protein